MVHWYHKMAKDVENIMKISIIHKDVQVKIVIVLQDGYYSSFLTLIFLTMTINGKMCSKNIMNFGQFLHKFDPDVHVHKLEKL